MNRFAQLDHRFLWHPFTQMRDWLRAEPIVIASGKGAWLQDVQGRRYLDANSSIWTNLHGHRHPRLNAALQRQLRRIAHSSALGFANEPASLLAEKLVAAAQVTPHPFQHLQPPVEDGATAGCPTPERGSVSRSTLKSEKLSGFLPLPDAKTPSFSLGQPDVASSPMASKAPLPPKDRLSKVFFSDNGSTTLEVALKLAYEFTRRTRGPKTRPKFLSLEGAYHGDTVGAVSVGHIDLFHKSFAGLLFKTDQVMAPYCYRCPFNRAKPERADARDYRRCHWECTALVAKKFAAQKRRGNPYAAFVYEPLMQGAAGMIPQPDGWLEQVTGLARAHGALLIADEVMTGFGRTGLLEETAKQPRPAGEKAAQPPLFASTRTGIQPDFLCLAKGLTGGYLPMAATITTERVFDAFLGKYEEFKSFFHGHTFTANQLGAAAGLASLELLHSAASLKARRQLQKTLQTELPSLWTQPHVGDLRQVGLVAGIELVKNWRTRQPYALRERAGIRVCEAMARRGVLTRPVGNVIVLMPPYCTTPKETARMVAVLHEAITEAL
jgi:adenosylmethionine-8-amino-7-oxononanoate aminotransferase